MPNYESFKKDIDKLIGINLDYYKETQMKRRINSLMIREGFKDYDSYYDGMSKDKETLARFINHLTINVSEFYRNPNQWKVLEEKVMLHLKEHNRGSLKIWSSACSTGEEPYSMVMMLSEFYPLEKIKILATDIDMGAIEKAKKGIYVEKSLENLPDKFIKKFFKEENGVYKISEDVKKRVEFKKIDLLKDRFPSNMDLISCRNVMIYFTDDAKVKLYEKFNQALTSYGIFFVGSTEQIIMPERFKFTTFETFFYQKMI